MVRIARADDSYVELPHRSARSADEGKCWSDDLVFLQACESFGFVGRDVSISFR